MDALGVFDHVPLFPVVLPLLFETIFRLANLRWHQYSCHGCIDRTRIIYDSLTDHENVPGNKRIPPFVVRNRCTRLGKVRWTTDSLMYLGGLVAVCLKPGGCGVYYHDVGKAESPVLVTGEARLSAPSCMP